MEPPTVTVLQRPLPVSPAVPRACLSYGSHRYHHLQYYCVLSHFPTDFAGQELLWQFKRLQLVFKWSYNVNICLQVVCVLFYIISHAIRLCDIFCKVSPFAGLWEAHTRPEYSEHFLKFCTTTSLEPIYFEVHLLDTLTSKLPTYSWKLYIQDGCL